MNNETGKIGTNSSKKNLIFFAIIVAVGLTRLLPHPPNFSVMGALALLAGAYAASFGLGLGAILVSMFIGDIFLGFHETQWAVYLGFALVALIGTLVRQHRSLASTVFGMGLGSLVFFAVSNLGVWWSSPLYAHTWQGLIECYVMAIPFMEVSLIGDLFFVTSGYLVFELVDVFTASEANHAR